MSSTKLAIGAIAGGTALAAAGGYGFVKSTEVGRSSESGTGSFVLTGGAMLGSAAVAIVGAGIATDVGYQRFGTAGGRMGTSAGVLAVAAGAALGVADLTADW